MKQRIIFFFLFSILFACDQPSTNQETKPKDHLTNSPTTATSPKEQKAHRLVPLDVNFSSKGIIGKNNIIWVAQNIRKDYRLIGYEKADTTSKMMFLISVFTSDVEENPMECLYGSYYDSSGMEDQNIVLKFQSQDPQFSKVAILKEDQIVDYAFIQNTWLTFEK